MIKFRYSLIALVVGLPLSAGPATAEEVLKLGAPLVTEASSWGTHFKRMNAELIRESGGELRFQFYFGGGDEQSAVERLRYNQYDVVTLTVPGLEELLPELAVMQLPMLFSSYDELDFVREHLTDHMARQFERNDYVFLGWGDYGFVYLFSVEPVRTQTDLQRTRFWVWDLDPVAKAFAARAGGEPILLPIQNVLGSLEAGEIQTIPASPLACIALQWHPKLGYMTDMKLSAGVGATVLNKGRFDQLSAEHQELLMRTAQKYHMSLGTQVRAENEESIKTLLGRGIQVLTVPEREQLKWKQVAGQVHDQFAGVLYSAELLERVRSLLEEYRQNGNPRGSD